MFAQHLTEGIRQPRHLTQGVGQRAGTLGGITVLARQVESGNQGTSLLAAHVRIDLGKQRPTLSEQLAEGLEHQRILAVEVRVEAPYRKPGSTHDLVDAGFGRTVLDQCAAGGIKNPFTGFRFFVVHDLPPNIMSRILFS
ncbi:hypothetical protein D3C79_767940 [compost metagenome]